MRKGVSPFQLIHHNNIYLGKYWSGGRRTCRTGSDARDLTVEDIIAELQKAHVRWKGFSHEDDTWEPLEHLSGCEQYIARFEEERDHSPLFAYCFLVPSIIARCKTVGCGCLKF